MLKKASVLAWVMWLSACSGFNPPPTATPTVTVSPTATATNMPTATATASPTATDTPTSTFTPTETATVTYTPSVTPTASITPQATVGFGFDNWQQVDLPSSIRDGIESPLIVFANSNDQTTIANIATPSTENTAEIVYYVAPGNPSSRVQILTLDTSTGGQIFTSANGLSMAYFKRDGLYMLNLQIGLGGRIAQMSSLTQRGILSNPAWSPNGAQLAVTLDTGYALDIFLYDNQGSGRTNLTNSGAYEFYPMWSPDGRYLAFVSDRATCPSWNPADVGACDALSQPAPFGGQVYVIELATGEINPIGDIITTEPPRWINNRQLVIAGGDQTDLLNPQRTIWLADVDRFIPRQVVLAGDENALYLSDTWSPDGNMVLVQRVTSTTTDLVLMSANGQLIRQRNEELNFPRFGMSAAWSAQSDRLAIGGVNGACPYGVRVAEPNFDFVATGNPPPSMCNPLYSANGAYIGFTGVNPRVDGRVDVYSASNNGFEATNLTVDLRGQMIFLGWVGGQAP
jgi:hypothetical protein